MAVARSRLLQPLETREISIVHDVLVIGGGITGIQTAIDLAGHGFHTILVERKKI